ncbi:hypothetical protein LWI28_015864 [Acer negundo]|uniref:Uncharacterized protein n=1 Tax=Acer negundo TaxID=4023 RepID=A0AAD5J4N1_ACENE|nr:hypothetical protein LWI28_015864 [Acer negundo]
MDQNLSGDCHPSFVIQGDIRPPRFLKDLKRRDQRKNENDEIPCKFEFDIKEAPWEDISEEQFEEVGFLPSIRCLEEVRILEGPDPSLYHALLVRDRVLDGPCLSSISGVLGGPGPSSQWVPKGPDLPSISSALERNRALIQLQHRQSIVFAFKLLSKLVDDLVLENRLPLNDSSDSNELPFQRLLPGEQLFPETLRAEQPS